MQQNFPLHLLNQNQFLLSNCTKQNTNNARIECKYPATLHGNLVILHCLVPLYCKKSCLISRLRALRISICFAFPSSREMGRKAQQKKKSRWIIIDLLGVLVCSIAEYFYSLFVFRLALRARKKYGTARKNTQPYHTPKRLIRYIYYPNKQSRTREKSTNVL